MSSLRSTNEWKIHAKSMAITDHIILRGHGGCPVWSSDGTHTLKDVFDETVRDGGVPNVVISCDSMRLMQKQINDLMETVKTQQEQIKVLMERVG